MMNKNPLVSVIVPNYNHSKFLNQRLDSIFNQTFKDFEVILLDDKSTDNSIEILDFYQDERISQRIYNAKNSGSTFPQWKKGLHLAKGELIWIAESDDFADLTFLEKMVRIFDEHQNVAVAYCDMFFVDENNQVTDTLCDYASPFHATLWKASHYYNGRKYIQDFMINSCFIVNASGVVFKKELGIKHIDKVLNYRHAGDWLFWNSILSEENSYVYFRGKEKLNYFRHHALTTRNYTTIDKKQKGLIERADVTYSTLMMTNLLTEKLASKKNEFLYLWVRDHSWNDAFQKSFCKILDTPMFQGVSKNSLYKYYIKYKIRRTKLAKMLKI